MKLKPTLWRTCRSILNPIRLRMLRLVIEGSGKMCVRDYAKAMGLPDSIASIYLRQMNARGLLGVKRDRLKVFYNADTDRSLPEATVLQKALRAYFANGTRAGWEMELMTILRAFSHFNRLAILTRLSASEAKMSDLFAAIGVCVKSIYHHLAYLSAAGLIREEKRRHRPSLYHFVPPSHPVAKVLMKIMLSCAGQNGNYYNTGTGADADRASRRVLKAIRCREGHTRDTWNQCGPMKPRRGKINQDVIQALDDQRD